MIIRVHPWLKAVLFIFALAAAVPARAAFTKLHSFSTAYADGANPVGQLAVNGSTPYGFTATGVNGYGSLFRQTTAGAVTTLAEFPSVANGPKTPNSGPVIS